jgi:ABC-2 type transport system ATP-binding protein
MIKVESLVKIYGKVRALDGLSFSVPERSIFGFVGPNGAGKTTTLKILATLLLPDSGKAWVAGSEVSVEPDQVKKNLGYMPDFFGVYSNLKANEYLEFYARACGIPAARAKPVAKDLLELMDLSHKAGEFVDTLSRGMKQRLCLARALVHDPPVLLLDEPASGLDPRARIEMRELLRELSTMGKTILISSHILSELAELCTDIGIIDQGRLVASGTVDDIMQELRFGRALRVRVMAEGQRAADLLRQCAGVSRVSWTEKSVNAAFDGGEAEMHFALKALLDGGIRVISFGEEKNSLEEVFMQVTAGGGGQ